MRILFLMQIFDPEPQFKGLKLAKILRKFGADIEILTGFPNYPGGKIYQGYSIKIFQKQLIDGFKIFRVPIYPSHNDSVIQRTLSYISFAFSSFIAGFFIYKKYDVIYVCGPPAALGVSAAIISKLMNIPLVYDIQDLWPDSLSATGLIENKLSIIVINFLCNFLYKISSHIIVQSPGIKKILVQRGVNKEKITVIYNWSSTESSQRRLISKSNIKKTSFFNILYAGNIGSAQNLKNLLHVASLLKDKDKSIRFYILGNGIELAELKRIRDTNKISNVFFLPRVSEGYIYNYYKKSDALIVHLKNSDLFKITIPSKTQSYMAFGKPIIMVAKGDAANLIKKSRSGVVSNPADPNSLMKAIFKLKSMDSSSLIQLGINGRDFYYKKLAIKIGSKKLFVVFQSLIKK